MRLVRFTVYIFLCIKFSADFANLENLLSLKISQFTVPITNLLDYKLYGFPAPVILVNTCIVAFIC